MSNKRKKAPLKVLIAGMVCAFLVFTLVPRAKTVLELSERKADLELQKKELEEENARLNKELEQSHSLEAVEKIAREQLGMVKKGEKPIIQVITE